jgi:molybdenum cofactor cytidylyltransferase
MEDSRLVGIYLAAGKSSRMGQDKLNLPLGNMFLGSMAFKEAIESKLDSVIAVTRKGFSQQWMTPFTNLGGWEKIEVEGSSQSESLKAGLKKAEECRAEGVLVLLADQPFVTRKMINQLIEEFRETTFVSFAKNGKGMPPALFSQILFKNLMNLEGDQGARTILRGKAKELGRFIEIKDEMKFLDIDTLEDYKKISRIIHQDLQNKEGNHGHYW